MTLLILAIGVAVGYAVAHYAGRVAAWWRHQVEPGVVGRARVPATVPARDDLADVAQVVGVLEFDPPTSRPYLRLVPELPAKPRPTRGVVHHGDVIELGTLWRAD